MPGLWQMSSNHTLSDIYREMAEDESKSHLPSCIPKLRGPDW